MTGRTAVDATGSAVSTADPGSLLRAYEAASMYYVQGETIEVIVRHLGMSRSAVSRLLAHARQEGVVWVSLIRPGGASSLGEWMVQVFEVRTHIVPVCEGTTEIHRLEQVTSVAIAYMVDLVEALIEPGQGRSVGAPRSGGPEGDKPPVADEPAGSGRGVDAGGVVVDTAQGTIMPEVSAALPSEPAPGLTIVRLDGASDPVRGGPDVGEVLPRMCLSPRMRAISFPVPAFFDYVTTREAMWSERPVERVLSVVWHTSLAVFGVGALDALNGALPSQVYEGGHLMTRDQAVLCRQNVIGDVCAILLRADGSQRGITLSTRAADPTPTQLAQVPRRLCVAAGAGKSYALLAALRAQTTTDLVVDDATARAVLELAGARGQKGGGSQ